jgi:hypothetical protein
VDHQLEKLADFRLEAAGFFVGVAHERAILGIARKISSDIFNWKKCAYGDFFETLADFRRQKA